VVRLAEGTQERPIFEGPHRQGRGGTNHRLCVRPRRLTASARTDSGNVNKFAVKSVRWRVTEFAMSDPDRPTLPTYKSHSRDARDLILRIIVVGFLAVLFWQAIVAAGRP
jgi:hypothetical protein